MSEGSSTTRMPVPRKPFLPIAVGLVLLLSCSNTDISEENASTTQTIRTAEVTTSPPSIQVDEASEAGTASESEPPGSSTTTTTVPKTTTTVPTTTTTTTPPGACTPSVPPDFRLTQTDPVTAAVELSSATYPCAAQVGLAPAADPQAAATVAAAGLDGPLLLVGEWFTSSLMTELERLAPDTVLVAGLSDDLEQTLFEYDVRFLEVDPEAVLIPSLAESGEVWLAAPDAPVGPLAVTAADMGVNLVVAEPDFRALPPRLGS